MQIVKAGHKIMVRHMRKEKDSSLDGTSSPDQVKVFQDWMDVKHPNWDKGKNLNKRMNGGYGKFGPATTAAWSSYGSEFMSGAAAIYDAMGMPIINNTSNKSTPATTTPSPATSNNKPSSTPAATSNSLLPQSTGDAKMDMMNIGVRIGIGVGILIVLVIVIKSFKK